MSDLELLAQYAQEVVDLCTDDYPADSERGAALERLASVLRLVKLSEESK